MLSVLQLYFISMVCILLRSSAVRSHYSQAYQKMAVTRGCISHILGLRKMLLSFQTGFNLINAAVNDSSTALTLKSNIESKLTVAHVVGLQVNHSPSFTTDAQLDREIKGTLIWDTLGLINFGAVDRRRCLEEERKRIKDRLLGKSTKKETK